MLMQKTSTLDELKDKSLEEIIHSVLTRQEVLTIQLPNGDEVIIQPKPELKPLPILEGYIPQGWKEAIYHESR